MSLSSSARRILCMAVGRRILVGGSIRSLSPTEGKFRVKGPWRGRQLAALFVDRNVPGRNEGGPFRPLKICSSRIGSFFAWQNGCDYREYACIKAPFFRLKRRRERMAGTAPDDDPV